MEVAKLLTMTGLKPASTFGSLVTRMDAGPTSGATGLHAYSIRAHAADGRRASRFPLAGVHLRASVKMSSITALNVRVVGGVFGIIRHGNPKQDQEDPTPKSDRPSSQVSKEYDDDGCEQPGVQEAPIPPPSRSPSKQLKELL